MRWFEAASIILIALAPVHSLSFLTAAPTPADATEAGLQELVTSYKKEMVGVRRSMGDIVPGFLISCRALPLTIGAATGRLIMTGVSIAWWFLAPTVFLAASTVCHGVAWLKLA